ncbi:MAG: hypothetical protein J5778_02455 [Clostridiales bacterium]|nr:hypothetical protein [Clostridiales bacterium]
MFDNTAKQVIAILLGAASIIVPSIVCSVTIMGSDYMGMIFGYGIAAVIGIVGIVIAAVSIKEANKLEDRKAKGVVGLILSICGLIESLIMMALFGFIFAFASNVSAYGSSLMLLF